MREKILLLMWAFSVAGCSTYPISNAQSTPVPRDRVIDGRFLMASPGTGKVTIKRDDGYGGSACAARIYVNAKPIADLRRAEKVVLYLPASDYIFSAQPNGICGGGLSEVKSGVASGAELTFRIGYGSNGDFSINATAF